MSLNADLREFVELLNSRGVEYVIVGAQSGLSRAAPLYRRSRSSAASVARKRSQIGFTPARRWFEKGDFGEADVTVPEQMIQLGRAPNQIHHLHSISELLIEDAVHTKI